MYRSFLVEDDRFAPHLREGEGAVIDCADREPVSGEMFVLRISSPRELCGYVERLVQLRQRPYGRTGELGWMVHFSLIRHYGRRLSVDEILAKLQTGEMSACDGPMNEGIRDRIVGRVVGVIL